MASHGMVLLHTPHAQGHGLGHGNDCSKETSAVSLPANPVILLPGYATARLLCCQVIPATSDYYRSKSFDRVALALLTISNPQIPSKVHHEATFPHGLLHSPRCERSKSQ